MASSKLGRLRQWAEEKISAKEKPVISEELRELEKDIELRKEGIQRLILASQKYHHALSKKKSCPGVGLDDADKMLPVDILGVVMIHHGEEFGEESAFGQSLLKLGRAHCKIATLQEAFALTFRDTFLASLERFRDEIREYEALRRKVEGRRLALEAASAKYDKLQHSKKEKDRREAEDELERTKQRYEETSEDIRAHMHAIQENEHAQFRALVAFLELEMNFAQGYVDVLRDVRGDVAGLERSDSRRSTYSTHTKPKPSSKAPSQTQLASTPPPKALALAGLAGLPPQPLKLANKLGLQADTSTTTVATTAESSSSHEEEEEGEGAYEDEDDDQEREEDGEMGYATPSRRSVDSRRGSIGSRGTSKESVKGKDKERDKTPSTSRPPSRTRSRLSFSRKRTNSVGNVSAEALKELEDAAPSLVTAAEEDDKSKSNDKGGKDKDKDKEKRSRRMSLGGWTFGSKGSASVPASGAATPNASVSTPSIPTASASTGSLGRTAKRKSTKRRKSRDREAFTVLGDGDGDEWDEGGGGSTTDGGGGRAGGLRKSGSFGRALGRRRSRSKSGGKKGKEGKEGRESKEAAPSLSHSHSGSSLSMASTFSSASVDASSTTSTATLPHSLDATSSARNKILKPPSSQGRKLLRALYDFDATSPDEMSFRKGEEIVVVQEVVDEWWLGEVLERDREEEGEKQEKRRGLFPRSYTEVVGSVAGPAPAPAPLTAGGASSSGPTTPSDATPPSSSSKPKNPRRGSSGQSGSMSMSNISVRGPGGFIAALFGGGGSSSASGSPRVEAAPVPAALAGASSRGSQDLQRSHIEDRDTDHESEHEGDHHHPRAHAQELDACTYPTSASDDDLHLRNPNAQPMGIKSPVYFGRFDQMKVGQGPNEVDTASFTDMDSRDGELHTDRESMAGAGGDVSGSEDDAFGFRKQMREIEQREEAARRFLASRKPGRWDVGVGAGAEGGGVAESQSSGDEVSFHTGSSASLVKGSGGSGSGSGGSKATGTGRGSEEDSGWDHIARPTPKQMGTATGTPKLASRTVPTTPVLTPKKVPGPFNFKASDQQLHGPGLSSGIGMGSGMGMGMGRSLSDNPALHSSSASSTSSHSSAAAVALTPTTTITTTTSTYAPPAAPPPNGLLAPPSLNLSASTASMSSTASSNQSHNSGLGGVAKRIPPPPPPRRTPSHTPGSNPPPALPSRPAGHRSTPSGASASASASTGASQSQSQSGSGLSTPVVAGSVPSSMLGVDVTPRAKSAQGQSQNQGLGGGQGQGGGGLGYDRSPFESAVELAAGGESDGASSGMGGGSVEGAVEGKPKSRNPFRV